MNEVGVWSIFGMILTGNASVLKEKPVPVPLRPPKITQVLYYRVINTLRFGTKGSGRRLM